MVAAPDVRGLEFLIWAILSIPILLGATTTLLAASAGAEAGALLGMGRHILATAAGGAVGWLVLGSGLWPGLVVVLYIVESLNLELGLALIGIVTVVFLSAALAGLAAYQTARLASAKLSWRYCATCGATFRSRFVLHQCKRCDDLTEHGARSHGGVDAVTHIREM